MIQIGYHDYLRNILHPLRIYDLSEGYGAMELSLEGAELDKIFDDFEETEREGIVSTAGGFGLDAYEHLLPYRPIAESLDERRAAVAALLRIDGRSFTSSELSDTISGCGVRATVRETGVPQQIEVRFTDILGMPDDFENLKKRIEQILPCHLDIKYLFAFMTWTMAETQFPTWQALDSAQVEWYDFERSAPPMGDDWP